MPVSVTFCPDLGLFPGRLTGNVYANLLPAAKPAAKNRTRNKRTTILLRMNMILLCILAEDARFS